VGTLESFSNRAVSGLAAVNQGEGEQGSSIWLGVKLEASQHLASKGDGKFDNVRYSKAGKGMDSN